MVSRRGAVAAAGAESSNDAGGSMNRESDFRKRKRGMNTMHARAMGVAVATALLMTIGVTLSVACPLCFSQADAQTADGLNDALLLLMGLTGSVLGGIAAFVISLRRRAGKVVRAIGGGQSLH